jgi:hypothetical protein
MNGRPKKSQRLRAVAAIMMLAPLAAGCRRSGDVDVMMADMPLVAASTAALAVESEQPLEFGAVLSVDSMSFLAADRATNDVWFVDAASPQMHMRRVLSGAERAPGKLLGISRDSSGWVLLDRSGVAHEFDGDWSYRKSRRLDIAMGFILAAAGDGHGGFALLVRRVSVNSASSMEQALVLVEPSGTATTVWVSPYQISGRPDVLSLSRTRDGWMVAGSDPPRVLRFSRAGTLIEEQHVQSVPTRRLTREILKQFRDATRAAGAQGLVQPPTFFPPITAAHEYGPALLTVPYIGGSRGESQGLDLYCRGHYASTLLNAPATLQVLLTERGVIAIEEASKLEYLVRYYRADELPLDCGR